MAENKKQAANLIAWMEDLFAKVPNLPKGGRDVLVAIAPWLALIFGILGIIGGIGALGLSPLAMLGGLNTSFMILVAGVGGIISSILMLIAYPKLRKKQYKGWEWLFWSEVVGTVASVLSLSIMSIIFVLVGFYLLFQIKSYYK
ncbi:MAG TPA: hypothetical protein VF810_01060 [Patescibacteria group bacterium]